MRALILAGGQGKRLQHILGHRPKALAPIGDKPFLDYQLGWLLRHPVITDVTLCLGHQHQQITDYYRARFTYAVEEEPLGTGGALKHLERRLQETFLVLNGDTYYEIDYAKLLRAHWHKGGVITMALWPELVNGGVYACEPALLSYIRHSRFVSLEQEVLPVLDEKDLLQVHIAPGYHIDIGTPQDYMRAQREVPGRCDDLLL